VIRLRGVLFELVRAGQQGFVVVFVHQPLQRAQFQAEVAVSDDADLARDHIGLVDDAAHAGEVVDVAVGVDQAADGTLAAVLAVEGQCRGGGLGGDQRVDHDDPLVSLDHVHVREVEAAQLVEARRQLEEAGDPSQLALPPEVGVGRLRRLAVEEIVGAQVPDDATLLVLDHGRVEGRDETAARFLEVRLAHRPSVAAASRGAGR